MCDCEIANLIDLSAEDDNQQQQQLDNPSINVATNGSMCMLSDCLVSPSTERRDSFDNNPFDRVQKLADRPKDPFETVEMEACFKARRSMLAPAEVKMANLLSLSDDNILDDYANFNSRNTTADPAGGPKFCSDSTMASVGSTIYHSALAQDLESESPPGTMSIKSTPDTGSSAPESGDGSISSIEGVSNSTKNRKALEYRKRLLKLSISNSTFNSPVSRGQVHQCDSGFSTIFSEAAQYSEHMLASESPLKLVDDDAMSDESRKSADAERDFKADLEMLKIPMLDQLPSPVSVKVPLPKLKGGGDADMGAEDKGKIADSTLPGLAVIREKLRSKRLEVGKDGKDVLGLIQNLKLLICDNEVVDNTKKSQAASLLEKLSSALTSGEEMEPKTDENSENNSNLAPPQPIVRQGTFDIELQNDDKNEKSDQSACASTGSDEHSHMTTSTYSVQSLSPAKEIPETMLKSSATYDGEPIAERENLILPHVELLSPVRSSPTAAGTNTLLPSQTLSPTIQQPDINEIIEQLGKLLEQHQLTQQLQCDSSIADGHTDTDKQRSPVMNPTFIVVMPTTTAAAATSQTHCTDASLNDDQSVSVNCSLTMRRRSQSLSIHDKVKIVQLNMPQPTTPARTANRSSNIAPPPTINVNSGSAEFKTPMRRNSFSSGTPYAPLTTAHGAGMGTTSRRTYGVTKTMPRYSVGLSTHQEQQPPALVRPFPHTSLNSFKPDLRRKCKTTNASSSIMKSSGPMKAVIPVKKVAPMLSSLLPAATSVGGGANYKSTMDTSMHLLANSDRMSYTSTPMPSTRVDSTTLAVPGGYPNACSTPALLSTPIRRGSIAVKNPRFSTTPAHTKPQPTSMTAGANGLKKRSLPELKIKSPLKSRLSMSSTATAARGLSRASLRPQPSVAKTSSITRAPTRLSTRASISGAIATNKENKRP